MRSTNRDTASDRSEQMLSRVSRRRLLQAAGLGGGSLALGGAGFCASNRLAAAGQQAEATPPASGLSEPVSETIAGRAALLNHDADQIFRFVADEIHYETYSGMLRGDLATLRSRAGNSVDQAILLASLLDASRYAYRFATGELEPEHEAALTELLTPDAETVRARYAAVVEAAMRSVVNPDALAGAEVSGVEPSPEVQSFLDSLQQSAEDIQKRAGELVDAAQNVITTALDEAGIEIPAPPDAALPELEVRRHFWVQVDDGSGWVDLDPSIPGGSKGTVFASSAQTMDALPDDLKHLVRITLVAEELIDGVPQQRDLVTYEAPSANLAGVPIAIAMVPANGLKELGLGSKGLLTGDANVLPCIVAGDGGAYAEQPLVFSSEGMSTAIDDLDVSLPGGDDEDEEPESQSEVADGEPIAVWLKVEVVSPDSTPTIAERTLFDRLGAVARANDPTDLSSIEPVEFVEDEDGQPIVAQLNQTTILHIDVARIPNIYAIADDAATELTGGLQMLGPSLANMRDLLGLVEWKPDSDWWDYPSAPNVTAFTIAAPDGSGAESDGTFGVDLLIRQRATLSLDGTSAVEMVHQRSLSGILNSVSEQLLVDLIFNGDLHQEQTVAGTPSISTIFAEAGRSGIPIRVVTSVGDLTMITVSPQGSLLIREALETGSIVLVPEQRVEVNGAPYSGWWIVDPVTGETTDQLENGKSYTAIRVSLNLGWNHQRGAKRTGPLSYLTLLRQVSWRLAKGLFSWIARHFFCIATMLAALFTGMGVGVLIDDANAGKQSSAGLVSGVGAGVFGALGGAAGCVTAP